MLPQCGRKHRRRQMPKVKRVKIMHRQKPRLKLAPLTPANLPARRSGFHLHLCFQFRQRRNYHSFLLRHRRPDGITGLLIAQQLHHTTGVQVDHYFDPSLKIRSARSRASAASLLEIFPPATLFCQRACSSTSQRGRRAAEDGRLTSLATGLESRVMRISFSIFNAASASGQRCLKSRIVIVFTEPA